MTSADVAEMMETDTGFFAWLSAKPKDEIVGDECMTLTCPLAQWLLETTGFGVAVGNFWDCSTLHVVGDENTAPMPKWAKEFAETVGEGHSSLSVGIPSESGDEDTYWDDCNADDEYAVACDQEHADKFNNGVISYSRAVVYKPSAGGCLELLTRIRDTADMKEEAEDYKRHCVLAALGSYP